MRRGDTSRQILSLLLSLHGSLYLFCRPFINKPTSRAVRRNRIDGYMAILVQVPLPYLLSLDLLLAQPSTVWVVTCLRPYTNGCKRQLTGAPSATGAR
ncbi:hypothetical protein BJV74DRAFT_841335 [Russula compacta]|nr:hypothetical protein BJV74DRAFT_841335 [Russula compacta]